VERLGCIDSDDGTAYRFPVRIDPHTRYWNGRSNNRFHG
jgi:hypothetical protein